MDVIRSYHVEILCVALIAAGVLALDLVVLPRTPDDAFAAKKSKHVAYNGRLSDERRSTNGWTYTGRLCREITVWSPDRQPTNISVSLTGSMKDGALFVDE